MPSPQPYSILFVCLGNICRSPLAEGVMRHFVQQAGLDQRFMLDSAGTGAWHVGNQADCRSIAVGGEHGVDLSDLRARQVEREDFYRFDLILAMDASNLADLNAMQPSDGTANLALYRSYCNDGQKDVPDPYYGGDQGFEAVYQMIERASQVLLAKHG
ncbi:MAG: low molecular weight phosphotyrosine protein phosphatase [Cohaesibacter sp.]|nr:low molecular weight phosphotyrosine protein phosphatase [Cohaesibacter sp.]